MVMAFGSCVKWPIVTNEVVEFEEKHVEVQDSRKLPINELN